MLFTDKTKTTLEFDKIIAMLAELCAGKTLSVTEDMLSVLRLL